MSGGVRRVAKRKRFKTSIHVSTRVILFRELIRFSLIGVYKKKRSWLIRFRIAKSLILFAIYAGYMRIGDGKRKLAPRLSYIKNI